MKIYNWRFLTATLLMGLSFYSYFRHHHRQDFYLRKPSSYTAPQDCSEIILKLVNLPPNAYAPLEKLGLNAILKDSPFGLGKMIEYKALSLPETRNLKTLKELRLGTYNLKNLFGVDDPDTGGIPLKSEEELKGVATAIKDINPDIMALEEVGHYVTLQKLADGQLEGKWQPLMIYSNSDRGINIAFLVKKDLALNIDIHSFTEKEATYMGKKVKSFSRDFPVMVIKQQGKGQNDRPLLIIGAAHLKSQRPSPGDMNSAIRRTMEANEAVIIKDLVQQKFGHEVPLIMAGDFNNDIPTAPEFNGIRASGMVDSLDSAPTPFKGDRITFPEGRKGKQIDCIWVSPNIYQEKIVTESGIHHYPGEQERLAPPSDHRPVFTTLDFKKLLKIQSR